MRKLILVLVFLAIFAVIYPVIKLDTLTWLDNEWTMDTNTVNGIDGGGSFYIGRCYVNLRGDITKDIFGNSITGRLTIDLAYPATPLKFAYFDYKIADALVFSGGVMFGYFGYLPYWQGPLAGLRDIPEQDAAFRVASTSDFGIMLSGSLFPIEGMTKNLISYYIQTVNGEGYNTLFSGSSSDAEFLAFQSTLLVTPLNGFNIGASVRKADNDYSSYYKATYAQNAYDIFVSLKDLAVPGMDGTIPVDFLAEYVNDYKTFISTNYNMLGAAYSVMLGYGLFNKLVYPYIRYDSIDPNVDPNVTNDSSQLLYLGLNIKCDEKGYFVFKPVYTKWLQKKGVNDPGDFNIRLELEWKTGFTILSN